MSLNLEINKYQMETSQEGSINKVLNSKIYDHIYQELKHFNILQESYVQWNYDILMSCFMNIWKINSFTENSIKILGPASCVDKYRTIKQRYFKIYGDTEFKKCIKFSTPFRKGDIFGQFKNQFNSHTIKQVDVVHKKDQVLILLKWDPSDQKSLEFIKGIANNMLVKENWKDKVRSIAIAPEAQPSDFQIGYFQKQNLTNIQHFIFRPKVKDNTLMNCFSHYNLMIVNKDGVVQYLSDSFQDITCRVDDMINEESKEISIQEVKISDQQSKKLDDFKQNNISLQLSNRFYSNLQKSKTEVKNAPQCQFIQKMKKIIINGKQQTYLKPIKLRMCQSQKKQRGFWKFMNIIKQGLPQEAFQIIYTQQPKTERQPSLVWHFLNPLNIIKYAGMVVLSPILIPLAIRDLGKMRLRL